MTEFRRYAIYWAPPPGDLARAAAQWLGWDPELGQDVPQPDLPVPLATWTEEPRRYGFHGTVKAPFRLAPGWSRAGVSAALATILADLPPVILPGLALRRIGSFLAFTPEGDEALLQDLAFRIVQALDPARAALSEADLARRRPDRLSARQRHLLDRWGYPYVAEEFRFHLTVSGSLQPANIDRLEPLAQAHFAPHLPRPFRVDALCLFGEAESGRFHLLERHALTG